MMEIMIFSTNVPKFGQFGAWMQLKRRANSSAAKLSVTAFRPFHRMDKNETMPIFGDVVWRECAVDQDQTEEFSSGMVDVVLGADTCPRIRFHGEGAEGGDLRVMVQFHEIEAAA
jgi:hypothetical protein